MNLRNYYVITLDISLENQNKQFFERSTFSE